MMRLRLLAGILAVCAATHGTLAAGQTPFDTVITPQAGSSDQSGPQTGSKVAPAPKAATPVKPQEPASHSATQPKPALAQPVAKPEPTTEPIPPILPTVAPAVPTPGAPDVGAAPAAPPAAPTVVEPPLALPDMDDILKPVAQTSATMDALEQRLDKVKTSDLGLSDERADLVGLVAQSDRLGEMVKPRIDAAKTQLKQLGPVPKEDQPQESAQIAAQRTRLTTIVSTLEGALKSTELVRVRADQSLVRVQDLRHGLFAANLFERTSSPLLPEIWRTIARNVDTAINQFQTVFGTWRTILSANATAATAIGGLTVFTFCVLWLLVWRPLRHLLPTAPDPLPSYTARASAAAISAPLMALPIVGAASVLYYGALSLNLIYYRVAPLALDVFQGVVLVACVGALNWAILEPRKPAWRLMNLSNEAARSLQGSTIAIASVYAFDQILKELIRMLVLPLSFNVVLSFVTSLAFAGLLLRVVATPFMPSQIAVPIIDTGGSDRAPAGTETYPQRASRTRPRWLKIPLLLTAVAIVVAALTGYVALSRFAAGQVVITGSVAVLVVLFHLAIQTIERAIETPTTLLGGWLAHGLVLEERHRNFIGRLVGFGLHLALATIAIPGLALAWGFSFQDVLIGLKGVMFGFQIGSARISLARILIAIGLFLALLFSTRILQRWLQSSVLRSDRMDPGIANSIHQGIGYAGFSLATLVAVSTGGIDITNLAIVAGALSVGIGFGLQSIVNNFVSGLILLVERPIKVGDWIVLRGGGEGFVRSISVRSTEIETFDRSSLIVPNSELISNVVTNWTHRNALGRVIVKVNASYKSDPEEVLRVLNGVATSCPGTMQQPAPFVSFDNLGADGLEFSIGVVVADITKAGDVKTQLRTGIFKAFLANGLEFPTVERDIYLRDLDGVKVLIARVLEERAREAASARPATVDGNPAPHRQP